MKRLLIETAVICTVALAGAVLFACAGCDPFDPRVLVEDSCRLRQAKVSLPAETTGDLVGLARTETPTTVVITVTFNKKGNTHAD